MDLNSISQLASEQGPVFWAAAAAVSLGLTLLVVALAQTILRNLRRQNRPATVTAQEPAKAPAPVETEPAVPEFVQAAYESSAPEPQPAADPEDRSLALLLRRLKTAGDRLEEMAGDLDAVRDFADRSSLKSEAREVEYVFRASGS